MCRKEPRNDRRLCTSKHGRSDTRQPTSCPSASRCRASVLRESLGCRLGQEGPTTSHGGPGARRVLLVTRLNRLARSTRDLLNVLDAVSKSGAGFRSFADAWADTTTAHGRLMLTILGGLAEFERSLILAGTTEGRKRAQARGVRFGRKLKLTPHLERREADESLVEIGRSYNVSHSTISRLT